MRFSDFFCLSLLIASTVLASDDVIITPITTKGPEVAIIGLHGALTEPSAYKDLMAKVQNQLPDNQVWVGLIGGDIANMPNPVQIAADITRIKNSLAAAGFSGSTYFFLAHSLGGVIVQDHLKTNPENATGLILLGSYIQRKYNGEFTLPTLTVGAELDGLSRVTRIMESYFVYIQNATDQTFKTAVKNFPVVLLRGVCHSQFADENLPSINRQRDLKPEVSFNEAHILASSPIASFIKVQLTNDQVAFSALQKEVKAAGAYFEPLIKAFTLEGFYHFSPPCYDKNDKPKKYCTRGSPWAEHAQYLMGGVDVEMNATDTFHPVDQVNPVHLPVIYNTCPSTTGCVLSVKTVSQNVYSSLDSLDTASYSASAWEMRVKMSSRQAIMQSVGMQADFNVVDAPSICQQINQQALDWAVNNSDPAALARFRQPSWYTVFRKFGENYVMGEDIGPYNVGPLWIWTGMKYTEGTDHKDRYETTVQSIMMKTPTNYWIKSAAGFHYCKLLSPAHAMEWIYVDGLRKYMTYGDGV